MDEQSSRKSMKNKGKGLGKTTKRMQQISSDKKVKKKLKAKFVKAPTLGSSSSSSDNGDVDDVQVKNKALNKKSSSKSHIAPTPSTSTPSLKRHLEEDETRGRKAKKTMSSPLIGSELCNSDEIQKCLGMIANAVGAAQSPGSKSDELTELSGYNPFMTADVPTYIPPPFSSTSIATYFLNNLIPSVLNILMNKVPYTTDMKSFYITLKKEAEHRHINKEENTVLFILHLLDQVSTLRRQLSQSKSYQKGLSQSVRNYREYVGKQTLCLRCKDARVNTFFKEKVDGKEMYVSMYCKNCLEKMNERNERKGQHKIRFYPITFRGSNFNFQKGKKIEGIRSVVPPSPAPHLSWNRELDSEDKDEDVVMMPSTSRSVASPKKKVVQKGKSSTPASSYKSISLSSPPSSDVEETAQDSKESSDSEVFDSDDDSSAAEESDAE